MQQLKLASVHGCICLGCLRSRGASVCVRHLHGPSRTARSETYQEVPQRFTAAAREALRPRRRWDILAVTVWTSSPAGCSCSRGDRGRLKESVVAMGCELPIRHQRRPQAKPKPKQLAAPARVPQRTRGDFTARIGGAISIGHIPTMARCGASATAAPAWRAMRRMC
eukprot:366561-Chlamydomonas_euryale.AAC.4